MSARETEIVRKVTDLMATITDAIEQGGKCPAVGRVLSQVLHQPTSNTPPEISEFLFKVVDLLVWTFCQDLRKQCIECLPVLSEDSVLYAKNAQGEKPSALWRTIASRFLDHQHEMEEKLSKDVEAWHLQYAQQMFDKTEFLFGAVEVHTFRLAIVEAALKFCQTHDITTIPDIETCLAKYNEMMLTEARSNQLLRGTGFVHKHVDGIVDIATRFLTKNRSLPSALALVGNLLELGTPEVQMELSNVLINNKFFDELAKIGYVDQNVNLILANCGTLMKPQSALLMWKSRQPGIIKRVVSMYEVDTVRYFLSLITKDTERISELLLAVAENTVSSNAPVTKEILLFMLENDTREFQSAIVSIAKLLPRNTLKQLYTHCLEHLTEKPSFVKAASSLLQLDTDLLDQEFATYVFDTALDGNVSLLPLYAEIVRITKRQLNPVEVELLISCCGDPIWGCFQSLLSTQGLDVFGEGSDRAFMVTREKSIAFKDFIESYVKRLNFSQKKGRSGGGFGSTGWGFGSLMASRQEAVEAAFPFQGMDLLEYAFGDELLLHLPYPVGANIISASVLSNIAHYIATRCEEQQFSVGAIGKVLSLFDGKDGYRKIGDKRQPQQQTKFSFGWGHGSASASTFGKMATEMSTCGIATHLMTVLGEGDKRALELLLRMPINPGLDKDLQEPAEFIKKYLVNSNRLVYEYGMKALLEKLSQQPELKQLYASSEICQVIIAHIYQGDVLPVDRECLETMEGDLPDDILPLLVKQLTQSDNQTLLGISIQYLTRKAKEQPQVLKELMCSQEETLDSLIRDSPDSIWTDVRQLLVSLDACEQLYHAFERHPRDVRFMMLFTALVPHLIGQVDDAVLSEQALSVIASGDEQSATEVFSLVSDRMTSPDVSSTITDKLLKVATSTTSSVIRSKILNAIRSIDNDIVKEFVAWVTGWTCDSPPVKYSGPASFKDHLVNRLIFKGNPLLNAYIQQMYNIRRFRAFIFSASDENKAAAWLKKCFAMLELSEDSMVDLTNEEIPVTDIPKAFPEQITSLKLFKNGMIDFSRLTSSCVIVSVKDTDNLTLPHDAQGKFVLSGFIHREGNKVNCVLLCGEDVLSISETACIKVYGGIENDLACRRNPGGPGRTYLFYQKVEKLPQTYTVPANLKEIISSMNEHLRQTIAICSPEMAQFMSFKASPEQQMTYFLNVYLPTRVSVPRSPNDDPYTRTLQQNGTIQEILERSDVIISHFANLRSGAALLAATISGIVAKSSYTDCLPLVDILAENMSQYAAIIIESICAKGPEAVEYCNSKYIGQKLCKLALKAENPNNVDYIYHTLTYFAIPEISDLYHAYSGKAQSAPFRQLMIFAAFYGIFTLQDLRLTPQDWEVKVVISALLKRRRYDVVAKFIAEYDVCALVIDTLGPNLSKFKDLFLDYPKETICTLLTSEKGEERALSIIGELASGMSDAQRTRFTELVLSSMAACEDDKRPFVTVLSALGAKTASAISVLFQAASGDSKSLAVIWSMVNTMDNNEKKECIHVLLEYITNGNINQIDAILPALDDSMAGFSEWPTIIEQLKEAAPSISKMFLTATSQLPSFKDMSESLLMRPDEYIDQDFVGFIYDTKLSQDTLQNFFRALDWAFREANSEFVSKLATKITKDGAGLDFTDVDVDITALLDYGAGHDIEPSVIAMLKLVVSQNPALEELLEDEVETQKRKEEESPETFILWMAIHASGFDEQISIAKQALSPRKEKTAARLLAYLKSQGIPPLALTTELWALCPVNSPIEREVFSAGLAEMSPDDRVAFAKAFAKTVSPLTPQTYEIRKLRFLVKRCEDGAAQEILRCAGIDRKKAIWLAGLSPDVQKYCCKIFNLSADDISEMRHSSSVPMGIAPSPQVQMRPVPAEATPYFVQMPRQLTKKSQSQAGLPRYARD